MTPHPSSFLMLKESLPPLDDHVTFRRQKLEACKGLVEVGRLHRGNTVVPVKCYAEHSSPFLIERQHKDLYIQMILKTN